MKHGVSPEDDRFRSAFEALQIEPAAFDYFMNQSDACSSYADLVRINPQLLDSKIMLTHYSADVLFSPAARQAFVEPNVQTIPPP